jgi:hypothetical protein
MKCLKVVVPVAAAAMGMVLTLAGPAGAAGTAAFGGAAPQGPAKTPKACTLLKTREVSRILGMTVRAGKPRRIPSGQGLKSDRCDWKSTRKGAGGIRGKPLEFNVATFTGNTARKTLEDLLVKDLATGIEYHAVPDLGSDAIYEVPTHSLAMLTSDTRMLLVRINPTSFDASKADVNPEAVTVAAAKLAIPRLEKG